MFTSRAEHRLVLRQDNADRRLMKRGHALGLVTDDAMNRLKRKEESIRDGLEMVRRVTVSREEINPYLERASEGQIEGREQLAKILKRPSVRLRELLTADPLAREPIMQKILTLDDERLKGETLEQIEIELKYEGYIQRQVEQIEKFDRFEDITIPIDFNYNLIKSLSTEGRERLTKVKPESIGQASRISGVTPSDVSVLMVYLHR